MTEWRDIASAPRDGTKILLACLTVSTQGIAPHFTVGWYNNTFSPGWVKGGCTVSDPTHWMPIPPLPHNGIEP